MCVISESNILLRAQAKLPTGFKVATEVFTDGWQRMRLGGLERLEKKVHVKGWNFIKVADCGFRSGVGDTSEAAIASAMRLALRRMDTNSNAVKVQQINLTQYPWFCLARVRVQSYRIQQGTELLVVDEAESKLVRRRRSRVSAVAALLNPQLGFAVPELKEMLIASASHKAQPMYAAKAR
jgi:hypothetical protein